MYTDSDMLDEKESIFMKKERKEKGNDDRRDAGPFIETGTIPTSGCLCSLPRIRSQPDNYILPLLSGYK